MAALISRVGYPRNGFVSVDSNKYENCVLVPQRHPNYENCSYSVSSNVYAGQLRASNGNHITPTDSGPLPVLSKSTSLKQISANKRFQHHCASLNFSDTGRNHQNHLKIDSSFKENDEVEKKSTKSVPGLLRRSLRLSIKNMGNGSSIEKEISNKKKNKKRTSHKTPYVDTSDNGGFESSSPKPAFGVKEKLRYSLDKINFKSPFRWNSSDKLTHHAIKGAQAKKSSRRYSDSNTIFLATDKCIEGKKTPSYSNSVKEKPLLGKSETALSRMVRAYPSARSESTDSEIVFNSKSAATGNHDYVNLNDDTKPHKLHSPSSFNNRFDSRLRQSGSNHAASRNANFYHDMSTSSNLQMNQSKTTLARAKGTWKILKTNRTKYASKVESEFPSEKRQESNFTQEFDDFAYADEVGEIMSTEPPKLAPVSGKLLLDRNSETNILKPAAFRPAPISSFNSSSVFYLSNSSPWQHPNSCSEISTAYGLPCVDKADVNSPNVSNNSDSGRLSVTSVQAAGKIVENFSCSGSEGYESARIPSSTNQSAVHDHESSVVDSCVVSPRKLSDEVMPLGNQVSKKTEETEILGNDRKERNEVIEETGRSNDSESLKLRNSGLVKLQRRSSAHDRQVAEQHFRLLHEEQQQLHDANNKLEERIKSMTEAIDAQSRLDKRDSSLQSRLEESEVEMQQQRGEISLLKRQVVEKQNELSQRSYELLALKSHNRDLTLQLTQQEADNNLLVQQLNDQKNQIAELEHLLAASTTGHRYPPAKNRLQTSSRSVYDLSTFDSKPDSTNRYLAYGKSLNSETSTVPLGDLHSPVETFHPGEKETLHKQLWAIEQQLVVREQEFDRERQQWAEDKRKVIKYQKLLQENYVQMYKRSQNLEREVKSLTSQLQRAGLSVTNTSLLSPSDLEDRPNLCYPMDI